MADYARPGDQARWARSTAEQVRRLRTRRPLRGTVPAPTFIIEGEITTDIVLPPKLIVSEGGPYPEFKQIIGFDGWLGTGGPVTISWHSNAGAIYTGHEINGGSNPIVLDEPFIVEGREWIQIQITAAAPGSYTLSCASIAEMVPI